jgi:hypothetical protein
MKVEFTSQLPQPCTTTLESEGLVTLGGFLSAKWRRAANKPHRIPSGSGRRFALRGCSPCWWLEACIASSPQRIAYCRYRQALTSNEILLDMRNNRYRTRIVQTFLIMTVQDELITGDSTSLVGLDIFVHLTIGNLYPVGFGHRLKADCSGLLIRAYSLGGLWSGHWNGQRNEPPLAQLADFPSICPLMHQKMSSRF